MTYQHRLQRSGNAPLTFSGERIAAQDGRLQFGKEHNRYHDLAIYRTGEGKYIVAIKFMTLWQGESDHASAYVCDSPVDAGNVCRDYDPTLHVGGFPPSDKYGDRQIRLMADVRARYDEQVRELLNLDVFVENVKPLRLRPRPNGEVDLSLQL